MTRVSGLDELRAAVGEAVEREGLRPLSARTGVPIGRIRSVISGRSPTADTLGAVCRALGITLTIGSQRSTVTPLRAPAPAAPAEAWNEPVSDRRLAELLARLADHWDTIDSAERREALGVLVTAALRATGERETGRRYAALSRGSAGG